MGKPPVSFKTVIWRLVFCSCLSLIFLGQGEAQSQGDFQRKLEQLNAYPDLIVVNGKIVTMDERVTQVQAMALKNSRILALGTSDQIRFLAGPKTEVLDAKGRVVLPGLIDGHTHPHMWATEHYLGAEGDADKRYHDPQLRIVYAKGNDQVEVLRSLERVVRQRAQELGPGKWIWVHLFAKNHLTESRDITDPLFLQQGGRPGMLTTQFLDTIAPNNPLLVHGTGISGPSEHNTKAKEEMIRLLGYEVGGSSGLLARTAMAYDILLRGRLEEAADMLKREMLTCLSAQGITTYANHYYGTPSIMKAHRLLYERGELPARWGWWEGTLWGWRFAQGEKDTGDLTFFYRNLGDFRGIGNDYIWNVGVSNEAWEEDISCTIAKPLNPKNSWGLRRDCAEKPTDYSKAMGYQQVKTAIESGLRIGFLHGYSDGTYDALFHMVEEAMAQGKLTLDQVRAMRISMEHDPIIRPDQVQKMAKYNMRPAFNGYQVQGNVKGGQFLKAYGEQYMTWIAPMKSLVDAGTHPVFNTDLHLHKGPPEAKDMDYPDQWDGNIWAILEFFVTRKMPHDGITYNRREAMDRVSLMKAATIWGAEQLLNEKNIGSLEVGKLADFIIIDKDYFTIAEDQIHTIKTLLTAVGGKVLFKNDNL